MSEISIEYKLGSMGLMLSWLLIASVFIAVANRQAESYKTSFTQGSTGR